MLRTSRKPEKKGERKAAADVDQSSAELANDHSVEEFEKACSPVESVFPACQQRDKEFLGFSFEHTANFRSLYLLRRYSMQYIFPDSDSLVDEAEQQPQGENSNYRPLIPGLFSEPEVAQGQSTFISVLQKRLSTFDGLFEEVFGNEPSRFHVKVPAQFHVVLGNDILEEYGLQKQFGCMAQFWHIFHSLQDIVDNIAAHVPESREHLCQIASMEMVEVLEMYCSCYDGDLLLLKSEEGHEHTDLKEFSVASSDLFNVSEFLPFFDDAYTILAQFFLIVDMCVGKELSSSAVSRSSDEWKSVVLEAKRMFNPSFYKCDVNEFRRRVVKPVPLQCPHVQPSKTEHQSMSVKPSPPSPPPPPSPPGPPPCISTHFICSALLLQNLEKMFAVIQLCVSFVSVSAANESGRFESESTQPTSVVHRLYQDAAVMFYAVFRRICILFDLGYYTGSCQLQKCTLPSGGRDDVDGAFSLLYQFSSYDKDLWVVDGDSVDSVLLGVANRMMNCIKKIYSYLEHDIAEYSKMLGECTAVLPADQSSVGRYLEHVREAVRRPAEPFHPRNETTASSYPQLKAKSSSSKCASSCAASIDVLLTEFCRLFKAEKLGMDSASTALDKEAENAAAEQNECSLARGHSSVPHREKLRKCLSSSK